MSTSSSSLRQQDEPILRSLAESALLGAAIVYESAMPVVGGGGHAGGLPSPPRPTNNQFLSAPRSSDLSNSFNEWSGTFAGLRSVVEEDGDESMPSSPAASSVFETTMVTLGRREDATAAWATSSLGFGRVDSLDLSGTEDMRLRDGQLSPTPPVLIPTRNPGDQFGIMGMDLNTPAPGEDIAMSDIASYASCRFNLLPYLVSRC